MAPRHRRGLAPAQLARGNRLEHQAAPGDLVFRCTLVVQLRSDRPEMPWVVASEQISQISLFDLRNARFGASMSLIQAIEAGCDEDALRLLAKESSPVAGEIFGEAFWAAITAGSTKVTEQLLDLGANPNTRWPRDPHPSALSLAMDHDHEAIVHLLVDRGADVNARSNGGYSLLWDAIVAELQDAQLTGERPNLRYSHLLIERGINLDHINERGETALDAAIVQGHQAAVKLIRCAGGRRGAELAGSAWPDGNEPE